MVAASSLPVAVGAICATALIRHTLQFRERRGRGHSLSEEPSADLVADAGERLESSAWQSLPDGIVEQIFDQLTPAARWRHRQICARWASVARQRTSARIIRQVSLSNHLVDDLIRLSDEHRVTLIRAPNAGLNILVGGPIALDRFRSLLQHLVGQANAIVPCNLEFTLGKVSRRVPQMQQLVAQSNHLIRSLFADHQIVVSVAWEYATGDILDPLSLWALSPLLSQIDCCVAKLGGSRMPMMSDMGGTGFHEPNREFSLSHLQAMQHGAASITTLRIGLFDLQPTSLTPAALTAIGSLSCLTRLIIKFAKGQNVDLQLLGQLEHLELLNLDTECAESSCEAVLRSSRDTLRRIGLHAPSWTSATYRGLSQLFNLEFLVVSINILNAAQAQELGQVEAHIYSRLAVHIGVRQERVGEAVVSMARPGFHNVICTCTNISVSRVAIICGLLPALALARLRLTRT